MDSLRRLMQSLRDDQIDIAQFQKEFAERGTDLELTGSDEDYAVWLSIWLRLAEYTSGHISREQFIDLARSSMGIPQPSVAHVL